MSEKGFLDRLSDKAQDSLASEIVRAVCVIAIPAVTTVFGFVTGSFEVVASYAMEEGKLEQLALWSAVFLLAGAAVGFLIRHLMAMRFLSRVRDELDTRPTIEELEAASGEIESLRAKIEEMENSPRYREPESVEELSAEKLRIVLKLFDDAETGSRSTRLMVPFDKLMSANLRSLVDMKVVMGVPEPMGLANVYQLTPKWTGIVRNNRRTIEALISDKQAAPIDEQMKRDLRNSSFRTKDILLELCDLGSVDVTKSLGSEVYRQCPEIECYVDFMDVGGGYERWTPQKGVKEAVDALNEIFDPVREDKFNDRLDDPFQIGATRKPGKRNGSGFRKALDNVMEAADPQSEE